MAERLRGSFKLWSEDYTSFDSPLEIRLIVASSIDALSAFQADTQVIRSWVF